MKREIILLTGGSGFIGRNLINRLKNEHYQIINLGSGEIEGIENIKVDLASVDFSFLDNLEFDYVIHLAAFSSPARSKDEEKTMNLNYRATEKLLDKVKNKNLKKFIFTSTYLVYKESNSPLTEDSPLSEAGDNYVKSKLLAESACTEAIKQGVPIVIFRLSDGYGPGQQWRKEDSPTLVPQLICSALADKKIEVFDERPVRDYVYSEDISEAIVRTLKSDYTGILNLGTGIGTSVKELATTISNLTSAKLDFLNIQRPVPLNLVLDIARLEKVLNWKPSTKLTEGLDKTVNYYQQVLRDKK